MVALPTPRSETSHSALERALHPQRIVLSLVAFALAIAGSRSGLLPLGSDVRVFVGVLSVANLGWNVVSILGTGRWQGSRRLDLAQISVDIVLSLAAIIALDSQSTPLAWILLFVPVLDAAVRYGLRGAVVVWVSVSLIYISILLSLTGPDTGNADSLRTGLQQVVALLAVAIPTLVVTSRLRGDLDATGEARAQADDHVYRMRAVSSVAQQLSSASDPDQVLALAAAAVLRLGFVRADVSTKTTDGAWTIRHASGSPIGFDVAADPMLARAFELSSKASIGVGQSSPEEHQRLHDAGYLAALAIVVHANDEHWIAIRGYSDERVSSLDSVWESLETLGALIAAAWANRIDHLTLSRLATQMQHEATHDGLTGLPNRIRLLSDLEAAMQRRVGGLALLFLDLDGFKAVNDSHGHDAGDRALRRVADRLRDLVGASGRVARLGGDEFVVLVGGRDNEALEELSRSIIAVISEPIDVDQARVQVGASVGVAVWNEAESSGSLMRRADEAMYAAKQMGKPAGVSTYRFSRREARTEIAT